MNVASLELSKELYDLSGWVDTHAVWYWYEDYDCIDDSYDEATCRQSMEDKKAICPAYDLGYLLRKLPDRIQDANGTWFALMGYPNGINPWFAYESTLLGEDSRWPNDKDIPFYKRVFSADTPEDALCKLSIELFKQGVLKRES